MKQLSQIKNKIFTNKGAFPKTQDQKNLERQKGELDSFMLSFSTHEAIVDSIQRTLFEIYKARNISGIHIRDLRVEDFFQLKDNWHGTFEERISVLEDELNNVLDGVSRDAVCTRVVELLNAATVAASYGGNFDDEVYDGWKSDSLSSGLGRRGSAASALTTPSRILASVETDIEDTRTLS